jgi:hypothetical protein
MAVTLSLDDDTELARAGEEASLFTPECWDTDLQSGIGGHVASRRSAGSPVSC